MPVTKSAAKAMRQSRRRRAYNAKTRDAVKNSVKAVHKLIKAGKKSEAASAMMQAMSALDKAAKKRVIHKNTAARKKSRLSRAIAKI